MDLYRHLFSRVLYPAWESGLRGRPTLRRLAYLEKTQWRPFDELEAIQAGALQRLLRHAYENVPFYRRRFATDNMEVDGWDEDGGIVYADTVEYRDYDVERKRISASFAAILTSQV